MRSRMFIGGLVGLAVIGSLASATVRTAPARPWMVANFVRPTVIAGAIVQGPVVIVHDDERMARGEACTTVYRFDTRSGQQEPIVSFMCVPVERPEAKDFTATCRRAALSGPDVLTEYHFAGEREAHGVPGYVSGK